MTNVRRPSYLQLQRPASSQAIQSPKALSPTGDSLPSQIEPYLFVGDQGQTNRETINRLNINYILSLGHLPIISTPQQQPPASGPTTPTSPHKILMPAQDCSRDFKIRISVGNSCSAGHSNTINNNNNNNNGDSQNNDNGLGNNCGNNNNHTNNNSIVDQSDENKSIKPIRSIRCKCINIADDSDQLLAKFFDEAHAFIDRARRKNSNILVHCLAGISRSPTFVIAYLMRLKSLHWRDAYELVKRCRPQTDPNLSFMGQLMTYNRTLTNGRALTPSNNNNNNNNDNGSTKLCDDDLDDNSS